MNKEREAFEAWATDKFPIAGLGQFEKHNNGTYLQRSIRNMYEAWQAAKAQAVPECTWTKNEDGYFNASCGQSFVFSEPEDKPSSHEFTHCCFCGGKLIEVTEPAND